ncbi:hypothetical protein QWY31_09325 [Cytophagales bacterium LB-30]|uniref:Uncharacterized protein n=1 Tax=Shiella aurantiaca TaxID=3058365 RepID=A0ABT8F5G2_9BACT|nr:hypothetical protein [Shiella aurantiaca]MDN4165703.1 hypothetical protein [Shiella aurantiaca]
MKKLFLILLVGGFALTFTACGGAQKTEEAATEEAAATEEVATEAAPATEEVAADSTAVVSDSTAVEGASAE